MAEQFKVLSSSARPAAGITNPSWPGGGHPQTGQMHDFGVFWTEDANRVMNDKELPKFQAVVFLSTTGDILNENEGRLPALHPRRRRLGRTQRR